jgi:UDP-N-acetylglucosamine--N-acetylmuramyl-(pentapeptide) pyrophosphoryl-undecaprenol N-acetylglucosamine transferase
MADLRDPLVLARAAPVACSAATGEARLDELRVLVASGDSVGHLSHAKVVLDALARHHRLEAAVVLPGDARFRRWIEERGYRVERVGTGIGENREFSTGDLVRHAGTLSASTLGGVREAWALLGRFRPDVVVGTGGRCSFAPMVAAAVRGYPTVTIPHYALRRANHALAYLVDRTCLAREADVGRFPGFLRRRLRVTHTPLRPEAFAPVSAPDARQALGLDPDRPVLALVGYSGGSPDTTRLFADIARRVARALPEMQLVVQYGTHPPRDDAAQALGEAVLARPFFDDLLAVFAACDLVVTAAGETTLLELCALGVPSICVPVADTPIGPHIGVLATDLRARGAVLLVESAEPGAQRVADAVLGLLGDVSARRRMAEAARSMADADATTAIIGVIHELMDTRSR